jgi:HK97 family phage prohead protease
VDLEIRRLAKPFRVQTVDEGRTFTGHGSVFDDPHPTSSWRLPPDWADVTRQGAFKKTLSEHKKAGTMPAMLFNHDMDNCIGCYTEAAEDGDGLLLTGKVAQSARTPAGGDIYELMTMGALNGLSIGFSVEKCKLDEKSKVREITEISLFETSIVTIPAQSSARVTDVKSVLNIRHLEAVLRDAGLSRTEAKALLSEGYRSFSAQRDAEEEELKEAIRNLTHVIRR